MFCELPALSLEFKVLGDEGPVEGRHPVGDEMVFTDPGLVIVVVG